MRTASETQNETIKIAGVMGWPIDHSLSPKIHRFWLDLYGVNGTYLPFAVRPESLLAAIRALPILGMRGANITLPHKERAIVAADRLTPIAERIGAVNTLIVEKDGKILGDNTDAYGFLRHLKESDPKWKAGEAPIVILGAGGAARAIIAALIDVGAQQIRLINRTIHRAEEMRIVFGKSIGVYPWEERHLALKEANLLVNTTRLGMKGQPTLDLSLENLPRHAVVYDIVYAPLMTDLLLRAQKRGHSIVNGIGMLLYQAQPGFKAWFGPMPEVTPELRAAVLGEKNEALG